MRQFAEKEGTTFVPIGWQHRRELFYDGEIRKYKSIKGFVHIKTLYGGIIRKRLSYKLTKRLLDFGGSPFLDVRRYLHKGDNFLYVEVEYVEKIH